MSSDFSPGHRGNYNLNHSALQNLAFQHDNVKHWFLYAKVVLFVSLKEDTNTNANTGFSLLTMATLLHRLQKRSARPAKMASRTEDVVVELMPHPLLDPSPRTKYRDSPRKFIFSEALTKIPLGSVHIRKTMKNLSVEEEINLYNKIIAKTSFHMEFVRYGRMMGKKKQPPYTVDYSLPRPNDDVLLVDVIHGHVFHLTGALRLNLTFWQVFFHRVDYNYDGENQQTRCFRGSLKINMDFKLCGQYSFLPVIPQSSLVQVIVDTYYSGFFNVLFSHSVMDVNIVESFPTHVLQIQTLWNLIFPQNKVKVSKILIRVMDWANVKLWKSSDPPLHMEVFDGPQGNTKEITCKSEYCLSETFYATLFLWLNVMTSTKGTVQYSWQENTFVTHKNIRHPSVFLFSQLCDHPSVCVLNITSPEGFRLNVSLTEVSSEGLPNVFCEHAGLALYRRHFSLSARFCQSTLPNFTLRNVYSSTESILAIFYQFRQLTRINITASIGFTQCSALLLSLRCSFNYLPPAHRPREGCQIWQFIFQTIGAFFTECVSFFALKDMRTTLLWNISVKIFCE